MKRRYFFLLIAAFTVISCRTSTTEVVLSDTSFMNGDLIFVAKPANLDNPADTADMGSAIVAATGDSNVQNYIHVAIVERSGDSVFIIDATIKRGVARYPIDTFFTDFRNPDGTPLRFDVMRLKEWDNMDLFISNAKRYVGQGYDLYFKPDNDMQYCSELVRNAYRVNDSLYLFDEAPMNFKNANGSFPPYWIKLFDGLGSPIPQDVMGTNPNSMSRSQLLRHVRTIVR